MHKSKGFEDTGQTFVKSRQVEQAAVIIVLSVELVDMNREVLVVDFLKCGTHNQMMQRLFTKFNDYNTTQRTAGSHPSSPMSRVMKVGAVNHSSAFPNVAMMAARIFLNTPA